MSLFPQGFLILEKRSNLTNPKPKRKVRLQAMVVVKVPPLMEILAEIPDTRQGKGLRHRLAGMLSLASVATLCGYENPNANAEWGRNYGKEYEVEMGFEEHGYP
jgi:hypothetical protein